VYNFLQDFGKRKHRLWESCGLYSSEKLMRYRELCIAAQNPSKSFQNKCHSVLIILRQELTENNLRKWRVRYDRCQRRVADETCRFLIR
jgi:hypothetical protein